MEAPWKLQDLEAGPRRPTVLAWPSDLLSLPPRACRAHTSPSPARQPALPCKYAKELPCPCHAKRMPRQLTPQHPAAPAPPGGGTRAVSWATPPTAGRQARPDPQPGLSMVGRPAAGQHLPSLTPHTLPSWPAKAASLLPPPLPLPSPVPLQQARRRTGAAAALRLWLPACAARLRSFPFGSCARPGRR